MEMYIQMCEAAKRKRIYLAGPMSNRPYFNFPKFFEGAAVLRAQGYEVFSPAEEDMRRSGVDTWRQCPTGSHAELDALNVKQILNYKDCMRIDLNWIIDNADAIALLPEWETSKGARTEKALAECLGLEIILL